jgi:hypothetical protein
MEWLHLTATLRVGAALLGEHDTQPTFPSRLRWAALTLAANGGGSLFSYERRNIPKAKSKENNRCRPG